MVADYFTKPLQGKLFKQLRDRIMGLSKIPIEERVGKPDIDIDQTVKKAIGTHDRRDVKKQMTYADVTWKRLSEKRDLLVNGKRGKV